MLTVRGAAARLLPARLLLLRATAGPARATSGRAAPADRRAAGASRPRRRRCSSRGEGATLSESDPYGYMYCMYVCQSAYMCIHLYLLSDEGLGLRRRAARLLLALAVVAAGHRRRRTAARARAAALRHRPARAPAAAAGARAAGEGALLLLLQQLLLRLLASCRRAWCPATRPGSPPARDEGLGLPAAGSAQCLCERRDGRRTNFYHRRRRRAQSRIVIRATGCCSRTCGGT